MTLKMNDDNGNKMNNQKSINWGTHWLEINGYSLIQPAEIIMSTPWSTVIRFKTTKGDVYLKQTPTSPFLALEPKLIMILSEQFPDCIPTLIASNEDLHCFMMLDAGIPLRKILKSEFNIDLLCQSIKLYSAILRSTENSNDTFISLGVDNWQLNNLPILYDQLIQQTNFLKTEGLTDKELKILHESSQYFSDQCRLLSHFEIPETLGRHDFHDNNILIKPNIKFNTHQLTFIDLGESAIIHPFFPLFTCLYQATHHHGLKETDHHYRTLQEACFDTWLGLLTTEEFFEMFFLIKKIWPVFSVVACHKLMISVDLQVYKQHYSNRPSQIARYFREFIEINNVQ